MQNKISTVHSTAELETVVGMQWEAAQSLPKKKNQPKTQCFLSPVMRMNATQQLEF